MQVPGPAGARPSTGVVGCSPLAGEFSGERFCEQPLAASQNCLEDVLGHLSASEITRSPCRGGRRVVRRMGGTATSKSLLLSLLQGHRDLQLSRSPLALLVLQRVVCRGLSMVGAQ